MAVAADGLNLLSATGGRPPQILASLLALPGVELRRRGTVARMAGLWCAAGNRGPAVCLGACYRVLFRAGEQSGVSRKPWYAMLASMYHPTIAPAVLML